MTRTRIRKLLVVAGVLSVLVTALALGFDGYTRTVQGQRFIVNAVNNSIPGTITCRQLRIFLLRGLVEISGGKLTDPEGRQVIRVDDLTVNLSWISLLKRQVCIEEASAVKPFVELGLDHEGKFRIVHAFYRGDKDESSRGDQDTGFVRNVIVKHLSIKDGTVHYENRDGSVHVEGSGVRLAADGNLAAQELNFTGELTGATCTGKGVHAELQKFFAKTSLAQGAFDPVVIRSETGFSRVSVKGSVSNVFEKPCFDLSADMELSLPELREAFGLSSELTGTLTAGVAAKGSLDDPEIRLSLIYGGGVLGLRQVDGARIDLGLDRKVVSVEKMQIQTASGNIAIQGSVDLSTAFPEGFLSDKADPEAISYRFSAKGDGIDLAEVVDHRAPVQGIADPDITVAGTGISPEKIRAQVWADMTCKKLVIGKAGPPRDLRLKSSGRIEDGVVQLEKLDALSGSDTLTGKGWIDLFSRKLDVNMELDMSSFTQVVKPFGIDADGRIEIAAHVSKTIDSPQIEAELNGKQIRYEQIRLGNIACTAGMDQSGTVKISRFVLDNSGSAIRGNGSFSLFGKFPEFRAHPAVHFAGALTHVELKDFVENKEFSGTWKGSIAVDGTLLFPDARITLEGTGISAGGVQIGEMQVLGTLEKGVLKLDRIAARDKDSKLEAAGTVKVFDPAGRAYLKDPIIALSLKDSTIRLEDVYPGYAGRVSVQGSVEGSIRHPEGLLNLTGKEIDLGFQKIHKIVLASRVDGERLFVDELSLSLREGETVEGEGWVSLNRDYAFHIWGQGLSLKSIDAFESNSAVRGIVDLDLSGQGSIDNPVLQGQAVIRGLINQENAPEEMVVHLGLENRELRMSGKLDFTFKGSYHLGNKDFSLLAEFDNTDISPYFALAGRPGLKGSVDGSIEIKGNTQDVGGLHAFMDLKHLEVFFKDSEIVRGDDLKASITGKELSIPKNRIILARQGWVDISGAGSLGADVVVSASGDIPLKVVEPFAGDIGNIQGQLMFTARVADSASGMDVRSDITLKEIGMKVPYIEEQLHGISGHITITREMVLFEKVRGRLGQGTFTLAGKTELKDLVPQRVGFRFNAQSLPVNIPDTMDLSADVDLMLEGTQDKTLLQGRAILMDGTYYRDVKVNLIKSIKTAVEGKPSVKTKPREITLPFLKNMGLDISVTRRGSLYVDNNIAQLDINPDLSMSGTLNNPIINGRASVVSGTVQFRNRTFTVTKGVIDFVNPYTTEAEINIESQVNVRDWVIYLDISGSPDELKLSLESDPEEQDNDILSLLVLGKTSDELMSGTGKNTESTSAMIAALVASRYTHGFKEATGLDIVEIESGTGENDQSDAIKVTIGKELSRRITLKYAMESKNSELSQRAVAEYKLFENVVLDGFQDTRGIFGVDMQLKLEFR